MFTAQPIFSGLAQLPAPLPARRAYRPEGRAYSPEGRAYSPEGGPGFDFTPEGWSLP